MKTIRPARSHAAFTMIEILTVIAIIAILAAILFPVFAQVRETARQSSTMSNMQAVYVGAKLFYEDEGRYPSALFDFAEVNNPRQSPPYLPARSDTDKVNPMNQVAGTYQLASGGTMAGNLYKEQVKDYTTFLSADDEVKNKTVITKVYWPRNSPQGLAEGENVDMNGHLQGGRPIIWQKSANVIGQCATYGDVDLPGLKNGTDYSGVNKYYYKMDAMDIGPMLGPNGSIVTDTNGNIVYELHYAPDWTHQLWKDQTCDVDQTNAQKPPLVNQLKYKNPPSDRTILTYVTHHVAYGHRNNVLILLLSGTARKISAQDAYNELPMHYNP